MMSNELNLAFDPALQPIFVKSAAKANAIAINDSRDLFFALMHLSEHYDALPRIHQYLSRQFEGIKDNYADHFSTKYTADGLDQILNNSEFTHPPQATEAAFNACLMQAAPIFFTELIWLAPLTQTATSGTALASSLMAIYLRLTKNEQSIAKSNLLYQAELLASGITMPDVYTHAFTQQADIAEESFDLAAIQLGLSQFPRVYFPEILGFTLSYCHSLSLPEQFFSETSEHRQLPKFLSLRNQQRKQELPSVKAIIQSYLKEFSSQSDGLWLRIQCGFWLHQVQMEHCYQQIHANLNMVMSPRQAMHKLLLTLIPKAIGHHGKIRLGGKTIDEWFKETPFKSENFLATLLHSTYVDRAKPENSKLLKLYEFNGPMFGVLDDHAKALIKDWLFTELDPDLLQRKKDIPRSIRARSHKYGLQRIASQPTRIEGLFDAPEAKFFSSTHTNFNALSNKDLYFYLVNRDIAPDILPSAKYKATQILTWTKLFNRLPFAVYSHQAFESYIKKLYQHEVDAYKPLAAKPKLSKHAYLWGIEQFAPTILADGCWLQNIYQLNYSANYSVGSILNKIYADEIGNGVLEQNHPHIFRELLESLTIQLPPVYSKDFIEHPGFISSAFDIPVYLMSISQFPNAFLPELLGLNLAIELSGLGKVYLRLSEELSHWGINPAIVDIHTSIDNLATGHAALAVDAVKVFLDEVSAVHGNSGMQMHWRRIHTGYCSLKFASYRFKISLIKHFLLNRRELA